MPIIKSAAKKLRQSLKKRDHNRAVKHDLKDLVDKFKETPTEASYTKVTSALDKAAKTNVIHKNKAARLKSRLSKLLIGSALRFSASPAGLKASKAKTTAAKKAKTPVKKTTK